MSRPHQDEQAYHAHFYEHDANRIFNFPIWAELYQRIYGFLSKHILQTPKDCLLSLASGEGRLEAQIAPRVGHILGIEICEAAVKKARARAEAANLTNLVFQVGDIRKLEMPPNSFDAVLALALDSLLCCAPLVKRFASGFAVVAHRPLSS